jgi:predicted GTPase
VDLRRILRLNKPCVRVSYEVEELTQPTLADVLAEFSAVHQPRPVEAVAH